MRLVRTEDAVGHVLCHDMTQILTGDDPGAPRFKGPRFRKGHVVTPDDVPVLLSMGKRSLYVFELEPSMVHEDDAAARMAALVAGPGTRTSGAPSEGKINVLADRDGVLLVDSARLAAVNSVDEVMVATRRGGFPVREGDLLAGTRVIPLVIAEERLAAAEAAAGGAPLLSVEPYRLRTAAVIATGSEVASGLIEDRFTPVMVEKLAAYGIETAMRATPGDERADVAAAIGEARAAGVDLVLCTGGMSVDPDDNTPGAIRAAGARVVAYGAPVLPGAMLLVGYLGGPDGREVPVLGVPGCAMYSRATVLDLVLPRIAAGVEIRRADLVALGEGGLCLGCAECAFPHCPFGR
ncbi:molybdopterin-binding protein [Thermophilibacter mediterraneus]|uniref:molybdopterin-binding protein n=1 Tax=Thermophilibacter mediterraneus TaxID=1871031 RepID=UPI0023529143|nr:molybdopterin-binding protein [Thermophilibacter mediterraneus]